MKICNPSIEQTLTLLKDARLCQHHPTGGYNWDFQPTDIVITILNPQVMNNGVFLVLFKDYLTLTAAAGMHTWSYRWNEAALDLAPQQLFGDME